MSEITVLRTESPIGHLEKSWYTELRLRPSLSLPVPIETLLKNLIDLGDYKSREERGVTHYYHEERQLGPLNYFRIFPNGIYIGDHSEYSVKLCESIARKLVPSAKSIPTSKWKPFTVDDLRYFSDVHLRIDNVQDVNRFIEETNPHKNLISLPKSDQILQFCLRKSGLETLEGDIYYSLLKDVVNSFVLVPKRSASICIFPPSFTADEERWCIGASLGYLVFGKEFGFDKRRYLQERRLQDYVLAYYLKSYFWEEFDPRDQKIRDLSYSRRIPALVILSRIWDRWKERSERDDAVKNIWENGFNNIFSGAELRQLNELND